MLFRTNCPHYTEQCLYKGGWMVNTFTTWSALVFRYDGFGQQYYFMKRRNIIALLFEHFPISLYKASRSIGDKFPKAVKGGSDYGVVTGNGVILLCLFIFSN